MKNEEKKSNNPQNSTFNIVDNGDSLICNLESKITFINELWVGAIKIPVETTLDFSGVHISQQEKVLEIALKTYHKDKRVNGR